MSDELWRLVERLEGRLVRIGGLAEFEETDSIEALRSRLASIRDSISSDPIERPAPAPQVSAIGGLVAASRVLGAKSGRASFDLSWDEANTIEAGILAAVAALREFEARASEVAALTDEDRRVLLAAGEVRRRHAAALEAVEARDQAGRVATQSEVALNQRWSEVGESKRELLEAIGIGGYR